MMTDNCYETLIMSWALCPGLNIFRLNHMKKQFHKIEPNMLSHIIFINTTNKEYYSYAYYTDEETKI